MKDKMDSTETLEPDANPKSVAKLAHDLNNIFGLILGNIQLAIRDMDSEHPAFESLEEVRAAARRGRDLVEKISLHGGKASADRPDVVLEESPQESPAAHTGQHILYLDDEGPLVLLYKRALERVGYRISAFISTEEALSTFRENPAQFDLVITDMNMPGFSGVEIVSEFLKINPDTPIILSSGYFTAKQKEDAHRIGVRHILYKPNTVTESVEAIRKILSRKK